VRARVIRALDISDIELKSWAALSERSLEQNPFFEPQCVMAAARHQADGDQIHVVLAFDDDTVVGCMPLLSLPRWHWSPRGAATTKVRRMTYLGTPLLDRSRAHEAMVAILTSLVERRKESGDHLLSMEWVRATGPVAGVIRSAAAALKLPLALGEVFERPAILREPESSSGRASTGAGSDWSPAEPVRRRPTTRKQRRRLNEKLQTEVTLVDRSGDPQAVEELIELEARGYKGREQIALTNWEGEPEYFRDMCTSFAADGRMILTSLQADGKNIASMTMFLGGGNGDEVYILKAAYDEEYSGFSPGNQLHYDTIDLLGQRGPCHRIDTCTYGGNLSLADIYPDRVQVATFIVGLGSPLESAMLRALPSMRSLRVTLRSKPWKRGAAPEKGSGDAVSGEVEA
jgi:CelD/BcsL family acetyltransferase involved in cellulose biosynthesis